MSRPVFPFYAPDISSLARSLHRQWSEQSHPPGHVQLLNMLAQAVGYQNFQHFRSEAEATPLPTETTTEVAPAATPAAPSRLLRHFDAQGRLIRWPGKFSEQQPCLWTIWARIPARREMSEREVNEFIKPAQTLEDHVLLRRELVNYKLLERTVDGRVYRRREQAVPAEWVDLLHEVMRRAKA
ncbi:DUF2087 domain-containing protein [Chitinimonas arctica]|uniref:DUF2087 domain-containing protein n=1 Tax=Chitinimonas arctica TaxID=2594795 RepID=A0A516SD74_9NEIS|nr:DUF2087 domain-containing protein [Chitinimonas arctica]QDQ26107.1 DUF2087 domain-containing protein [Chitinimonas arctica]